MQSKTYIIDALMVYRKIHSLRNLCQGSCVYGGVQESPGLERERKNIYGREYMFHLMFTVNLLDYTL